MNISQKRTRAQILSEKLTHFFGWLLAQDYVCKVPQAAEAMQLAARLMCQVDPQTNTLVNYVKIKTYSDEWIKPAFDRDSKGRWFIKNGLVGEEKGLVVYPDNKPAANRCTWYDWLMFQNIGYWGIEREKIPEKDVKMFFDYLNCFLYLTSDYNVPTPPIASAPPAQQVVSPNQN